MSRQQNVLYILDKNVLKENSQVQKQKLTSIKVYTVKWISPISIRKLHRHLAAFQPLSSPTIWFYRLCRCCGNPPGPASHCKPRCSLLMLYTNKLRRRVQQERSFEQNINLLATAISRWVGQAAVHSSDTHPHRIDLGRRFAIPASSAEDFLCTLSGEREILYKDVILIIPKANGNLSFQPLQSLHLCSFHAQPHRGSRVSAELLQIKSWKCLNQFLIATRVAGRTGFECLRVLCLQIEHVEMGRLPRI